MTSNDNSFNCKDAAALLGFPTAEVGPCDELLPGLWRVVLKGPDAAPEGARVETFIWADGARSMRQGPSALAAYLQATSAHALDTIDTYAVQVLLEATAGGPPGFAPTTVNGAVEGFAAGVTTRPFGLTLVQGRWTRPVGPPDPGQPPRPTEPGPLGPPPSGPPPGMAPPGGPPPGSRPPGMAPPGGLAPPSVSIATLVLDADYKGAWTIKVRAPFSQTFETVLTVPVEP